MIKIKLAKKIACFVMFAVCSLFLSACGYTTRSAISNKYRTIYITPFINKIDITKEMNAESKYKIYRPSLETDVTVAVTNKFLFDGNLKPVKEETADLTLKGEVVDFARDPLRYSDNEDVQEYRVNVRVNMSLWDNRENRVLWEESNFTGYANYFTSFYPVASERKDESVAVAQALDDLARRVVERAVEEW
ncbi:MAG: LPS assembly lipoprotein LptE [Candidatus Omnitrophica bacterium]|nr:LPS assembly lipoprotein LptE [Candidatus Omnitrophota bacterium]